MKAFLRRVRCYLDGHQDVRVIPHKEVCEIPWETKHLALMEGEVDRVCAYCDSDWL